MANQQIQQVMAAQKAHEAVQDSETAANPLNFIPGIEGDRDRQKFIIKVYSLITIMLVWTVALCYFVSSNSSALAFVFNNIWLFYVCLIGFIAVSIGMSCHYKKCRKVPLNYALLVLYTLFHSYVVAAIIPHYKVEAAIYAAVATLFMFIGLTAYACFTKTDMTKMGGLLSSMMMMVFVFLIFQFVIGYSKGFHLFITLAIICLMSVWIVYDTQIIVGGKHRKYQLDLDDYVLGAIIIYSDILTIFLYVLSLFGGGN